MTLQKTPLYEKHLSLDAKMVPFAGFEMPVRYTSLTEEHMAVRESVGVFDVSHMGEFLITGKDAVKLIQKISSNDVTALEVGQAQLTCMPNNKGGIVDDMLIYKIQEDQYMLVVNGANLEKDWQWISDHNDTEAKLTNKSSDYALIAVQGPKACELLQQITEVALDEIQYYRFTKGTIGGIEDVIISATGYTGSGGFELYVNADDAGNLWDAIFSISSDIKVLPAGLGARDTLRLEVGFCLYGNDITDDTSPIEAGLSWITKFNHDFVNAGALLKQKEDGPSRRLVGFVMEEKGIPRQGYDILNTDGQIIGKVTSGTLSPLLEKGIGMGYVSVPNHKKGTPILIQIRKKQLPAVITRPPFVNI